jgi:protein disulfide-isomerase A6
VPVKFLSHSQKTHTPMRMLSSCWPALMACVFILPLATANYLTHFTSTELEDFLSKDHPPMLLQLHAPWCGKCKDLAPELEKVAHAFKRFSENVVIAAINADEYKDIGAKFGIQRYPMFRWLERADRMGGGEVVNFPSDAANPSAQEFVDFINGKTSLSVHIKHFPSRVVELKDENFDKVVLDPAKHVLVMFTAPWCGQCKILKPDYQAVADAFADETDIVIASVDGDSYRELTQRFDVRAFPSFKFFPKDNKKSWTDYKAAQDRKSFIDFLNEQCDTERSLDGLLLPHVGRNNELDILAREFMEAETSVIQRRQIADKTLKQAGKDSYYHKVMAKALKNGDASIAAEIERLREMIEFFTLSPQKITAFSRRLNILYSFLDAVSIANDTKKS